MKFLWAILMTMFLGLSVAKAESFGFVDLPKGCFAKGNYPCQVRATGGQLSIHRGDQSLVLSDGGSLSFFSATEVQVLSGGLWIRKSSEALVRVSSLLKMQVSGEWLFEKMKDGQSLVRNLAGEVIFQSKQVFQSEALPVGFQNWYGPLDSYGQVSRGVIRPIEMAAFLKQWIPLSGMSVAEMKKQAQDYREAWKEAPEISAQFYGQIAARRIAAVEEKERKRLDAIEKVRLERHKIKEMYRARQGLLGPDGL